MPDVDPENDEPELLEVDGADDEPDDEDEADVGPDELETEGV